MNKKAQAALEFLVTYSWALLAILITVGALYYFGVFDFGRYLPQKCNFPVQFKCLDFVIKEDEVKLEEIRTSEETIAALTKKPVTTSSLRTFKGDMARAIAKGASQASIALAEEERRRARGTQIPEPQSTPLLLCIAGVSILGYVFIIPYFTAPASVVPVAAVNSIIPAEETQSVSITSMRTTQVTTALSKIIRGSPRGTGLGDMLHIYFTTQGSTASSSTRVSAPLWRDTMLPRMPVLLARTLTPEFMYGVLRSERPSGFLILSVESPSVALSGMLAWEKTLASEILPLITGEEEGVSIGLSFQDKILRNLDTRILFNENGESLLLYSVLSGKKYVIITRDQSTFDELVTRLATP